MEFEESDEPLQIIRVTAALEFDLSDPIDLDSEFLSSSNSDFFSDTEVADNDIFSTLPEGDEWALTDAILENPCVSQENEQSLLARDEASCLQPVPLPPVPLIPGTLKLFEDPLDSLERVLPPNDNTPPSSLPINPNYPEIPAPEDQSRGDEEGRYHDGDLVNGEEWRRYTGKIHRVPKVDEPPCGPYLAQGYIYPLCCLGPVFLPNFLQQCSPKLGTLSKHGTSILHHLIKLLWWQDTV